jgi:hypothetical protein
MRDDGSQEQGGMTNVETPNANFQTPKKNQTAMDWCLAGICLALGVWSFGFSRLETIF